MTSLLIRDWVGKACQGTNKRSSLFGLFVVDEKKSLVTSVPARHDAAVARPRSQRTPSETGAGVADDRRFRFDSVADETSDVVELIFDAGELPLRRIAAQETTFW